MGYGSDLGRVGALRCPDLAQKGNHGYFPTLSRCRRSRTRISTLKQMAQLNAAISSRPPISSTDTINGLPPARSFAHQSAGPEPVAAKDDAVSRPGSLRWLKRPLSIQVNPCLAGVFAVPPVRIYHLI